VHARVIFSYGSHVPAAEAGEDTELLMFLRRGVVKVNHMSPPDDLFQAVPSIVSAGEALPGAILVFPVLGLNALGSHCAPTPLALFGRGPQTNPPSVNR